MSKPLAEILRTSRQNKSLTQEQLAAQLYVTRQTVSSWEKGRTEPDLETLRKVCRALDLSPEELLLGSSAPEGGSAALIRSASVCFWSMTALCLLQGILACVLRSLTPGLYAGLLFLCQVTFYPIFSYMLRHRDYTLLAGYDANAEYDFPALRHMVALLHVSWAANGLLAAILGGLLFVLPPALPWLILVYMTNLCVTALVIENKCSEQVYLPGSRDRSLARMTKWSTLLGVLMLLTGVEWGVALCFVTDPQTLPIGPFLLSLFGQQICGGLLLFSQNRAARIAVNQGVESCPLTRTSRLSLVAYILLFLWMTWVLL